MAFVALVVLIACMTDPSAPDAPTGMRSARRQLAVLYDDVRRRRDEALVAVGTPHEAGWLVALVPAHRAALQPTAAERHAAFAHRLRELVAFVRAHGPDEDPRTLAEPPAMRDLAARLVSATCSACGGACCGNGGDHAFLRSGTVRAFMTRHPHLDDDGVVAAYLAFLPREAMHPGCVYQGVAGCTLPRDMRSTICNAYLCGGLQHALHALQALAPGETRGVYVAQRDGRAVTGGVLQRVAAPSATS